MQYDGYEVGPVIRQLRQERKLTIEKVSEMTGVSGSSLKQIEQGGRNMSMQTLYKIMDAYQCDANTVLGIEAMEQVAESVDDMLKKLPIKTKEYLLKTFQFMIGEVAGAIA